MPKEYVPSMFEGQPSYMSGGNGGTVLWGTNDYVQVATTNPEAGFGSVESGLYVDLDRRGINDLIRLLRKARDKAYGRDE